MARIDGFNLVNNGDFAVTILNVPNGTVDRFPATKYEENGTDPFDITRTFKVGAYYEDTFNCKAHLTPAEYAALVTFIEGATELRIEFTVGLGHTQTQYIITDVTKQPNYPDDLLEFRATITFTLLSRYYSLPEIVEPA